MNWAAFFFVLGGGGLIIGTINAMSSEMDGNHRPIAIWGGSVAGIVGLALGALLK